MKALISKGSKGFSLIEVIIALLISAIFMLGIVSITRSARLSFTTTADITEAEQSVEFAMEKMVREIREASSITPSGTQISFTNTSGTIRYSLNGSTLMRTGGTTTYPVANNINSLQFSTSSTSSVDILLVGKVNGRETRLTDSVTRRN